MEDKEKGEPFDNTQFNPHVLGLILRKLLLDIQQGNMSCLPQSCSQERSNKIKPLELFTIINKDINEEAIYRIYETFEVYPDKLTIFMNSICTDIFNGIAIYNILNSLKCRTITINVGMVSGAAMMAFMGAQLRYCLPFTTFYFYDFMSDDKFKKQIKNESERKSCAGDLRNKLIQTFTEKTKGKEGLWIKSLSGRTFTAEEAVEIGIVNQIITILE